MLGAARRPRARFTIVAKKSVIGVRVINAQCERLGKIDELVIDTGNTRVAYAILSLLGFPRLGEMSFAIPWETLSFELGRREAVLNIDKARQGNAHGLDKFNWPEMSDPSSKPSMRDDRDYHNVIPSGR